MTIKQVAIIGRPNVGKSTLLNRLIGQSKAITFDMPGTTRDPVFGLLNWRGRQVNLIDTAGLLEIDESDPIQRTILEVLKESSLILFVVDAKAGLLPKDHEVARFLRKLNKPIFVVVNKSEVRGAKKEEFGDLGFKETFQVSAFHGKKIGNLLDAIIEVAGQKPVDTERNKIKIAIVGRPNVGKSTLLNHFAGSDYAIVQDEPGTTRDPVDLNLEWEIQGKKYKIEFTDTAGIRRRSRNSRGLEFYSFTRAIRAAAEADVVLLVLDSYEGQTQQDAALAGFAINHKKNVFIIYNKIDRIKDTELNYQRFSFMSKLPSIALSLKSSRNVDKLDTLLNGMIERVSSQKQAS